jgi:hypothetical protein
MQDSSYSPARAKTPRWRPPASGGGLSEGQLDILGALRRGPLDQWQLAADVRSIAPVVQAKLLDLEGEQLVRHTGEQRFELTGRGRRIVRSALAVVIAATFAIVIPATASAKPDVVRAPIAPMCKITPGNMVHLRHMRYTGLASLAAFCLRYGKPLSPHPVAHKSHAYCGRAGCSWILIFNQGGGWAWSEYGADPYPWFGGIWYGAVSVVRTNASTRRSTGWSEKATSNCGRGRWCGYHQDHPRRGFVVDTMSGWCISFTGIAAGIGPVAAWTKVT